VIPDEEFQQMMLNYFGIAAQRHEEIMALGTDILAKLTATSGSFDTFKATFEKELADISATVPAGHAAVLDGFVGPLDELKAKIDALTQDIPAKMAAVQVPGSKNTPAPAA
jgi:hypothetical protein